jgi:energy-coupling factor transporter ATP-binding protein EcfA2
MKLEYLDIRRMPGFSSKGLRFTTEQLSQGINVIFGTNGAGKTTTCKAIRALLWPTAQTTTEPVSLHSVWTAPDQAKVEIRLEGTHCKVHPPAYLQLLHKHLPAASYASCYTLTIEDLLTSSDTEFAAEIAKQLRGGYDFNLVRTHPFFVLSKQLGKNEKAKLEKAQIELRSSKEQEKFHKQEEDTLNSLTLEIQKSRLSEERIPFLKDALKLSTLEEFLCSLSQKLAEFPAGMAKILANDQETVTQWNEQKTHLLQRLHRLESKINESQQALHTYALAKQTLLSPPELKALARSLKYLKELQEQGKEAFLTLETAQKILHKHASFIHCDMDQLEDWDLASASRLQKIAHDYQQLKIKKELLQTKFQLLSSKVPTYSNESLRQGMALLNQWNGLMDRAPARRQFLAGLLCVGGSSSLAIATHYFSLAWEILSPFILISGLAAFLWLWKNPYFRKQHLQKSYQRLELPQPLTWSTAEIDALLEFLANEWGQGVRYHEDTGLRQELLYLQQTAEANEQKVLEDLAEFPFPFDEEASGSYPILFEQIKNVLLAKIEVEQSATAYKALEAEIQHLFSEICAQLAPFTADKCLNPVNVHQVFETMCEEIIQIKQHQQIINQAQSEIELTTKELATATHYLEALFTRCECFGAEREVQLADRLRLLEEFQSLKKTQLSTQMEAHLLKKKCETSHALLELSPSQLHDLLAKDLASAQILESLLEQRTALKHKLQLAQAAFNLEKAEMHLIESQLGFEKTCEEFHFAVLGQFFLDLIEEEYQKESEPEVYTLANQWFSKFTHAKYAFLPPVQKGTDFEFMALDILANETKSLGELSRGTQTQLILAVRLAFNLFLEKEKILLPLFLDEALNSCDPERFQEITKALFEIAATGRQIFYFTCHDNDVERWQWMSAKFPNTPFASISLSTLSQAQFSPVPFTLEALRKPVAEESLVDYAAGFKIPPIQAALGAGPVSVYYLVETASEFYYLQALKIETYGQLKHLLETHQAQESLKNFINWPKIQCKSALLEHFFELWTIGKGKEIHAEVLVRGGVSEKYIDPILEIARQLTYNANQLLEALSLKEDERLKGFRQAALAKLKTTFLEEGYLDPRTPVAPEDFQINLLKTASPFIQKELFSFEDTLIFIEQLHAAANHEF